MMPFLSRELRDTPPAVYVRELLDTCVAEIASGQRDRALARLWRWNQGLEWDLMEALPLRTYSATARAISRAIHHLQQGAGDFATEALLNARILYGD